MNYIFFDTETTSRDSTFGQILEVSAILCNDNFQILDEPFVAKCSLRSGIIPEVGAMLVTNTTPQILKKRNLSHYQMIQLKIAFCFMEQQLKIMELGQHQRSYKNVQRKN